jgi:hypothetical protein
MPLGFGKKKDGPEKPTEPTPAPPTSDIPDDAPGWDAIDSALSKLFPGREPFHWGTNRFPGQDGLYGVSAYREADHWFFVTYGLSELFGKQSDDPTVSGWGFELTMRTTGGGSEPPVWPRALLDRLGEYVFSSNRPFGVGHRLDGGSPITGGNPPTRLTALAFAADPELAAIQTPNGETTFLTVLGITSDELAEMKASTTAMILDQMRVSNPLLVTDPSLLSRVRPRRQGPW